MKIEITLKILKELLDYFPLTGIFTRKVAIPYSKVKVGDTAGGTNGEGYTHIGIDGKKYKAHRLAWLYHYGEWPKGQIDHLNGVRTDNRICNLRDVTNRQNSNNKKRHREGHLVGTFFDKRRGTWQARIYVKGKCKYLGTFNTQQEASDAYQKALII